MQEIEVKNLSKSFGSVKAVNNVTFKAKPGRVTGFLGPNGSGKTTTLSMIAGLTHQDSGSATIGGKTYREIAHPMNTVGVSLSAVSHPSHTGLAHLEILRRASGMPPSRVTELLDLVGLSAAADRKTGGYSLGMKQRLALAAALMGDPQVLILDEPVNGLDPEGIRWIRDFLRFLANDGKTVLLSSHLLSEVEQTADDVVVIRQGEIVYAATIEETRAQNQGGVLLVDALDKEALFDALKKSGIEVKITDQTHPLQVSGTSASQVGQVALANGLVLTHLSEQQTGLEALFMQLTAQANQTQADR